MPEGNLTFFYGKSPEHNEEIRRRLAEMGQTVVSETLLGKHPVFITEGGKAKDDIIGALKASGTELALKTEPRKVNWWAFRGWASNVGQIFQMTSAFKERAPGQKLDYEIFAFAALNLLANIVNILFGGQKEPDKYRLLHIKDDQKKLLSSGLSEGVSIPDMETSRSALRKDVEPPPGAWQKFRAFMGKHSVRFGEIGLRFLGSAAMVIPVSPEHWKGVAETYNAKGTWEALKQSVYQPNSTKRYAGITYLVGKTVGLFSKVPDPYNPRSASTLDRIREKYFFRASSVIETGAAGILALGSFKSKKRIGGTGGLIFMGGLTTRFFAPFGHREVNVDEAFAYAGDFLAREPREKLPQLVAESAALLARDLSGDHAALSYGAIYARLKGDLYTYHNIAFDGIMKREETGHNAPSPQPVRPAKQPSEFKHSSSEMVGVLPPSSSVGHASRIALNGSHAVTAALAD
jgi:hypothetical protein